MFHNYDLYKAFNEKSLGKFIEALEVYEANPNAALDCQTRTIFEIILSTPDSASYIEKCIEYGADFYVKNEEHKYPIHYVIESKCIKNLTAVKPLLRIEQPDGETNVKASPYVNVKDHRDQNCLHLLAETLSHENSGYILKMMEILISHGCNINSPNDEQETPLLIVARKLSLVENPQEFFDKLTKGTEIDFYTHKGDEIVKMVKDYLKEVPVKESFVVCYEEMRKLLESGDINKFETKFSFYKPEKDDEMFRNSCYSYLEIAVQKSYINIVDLLIKKGIDFNQRSLDNKLPPPFLAYKNGNVGIFKSFLVANTQVHKQKNNNILCQQMQCEEGYKINLYCDNKDCEGTLLHQFFSDLKKSTITKFHTVEMSSDEKKCFELLLNDPRCTRTYLNAPDENNKPVIYYSVGYGVDYMTMKLIQKGAYIGSVITKIRKSLLSDCLDSCITSNNEFHDNKKFTITVNYGFLRPVPTNEQENLETRKAEKLSKNQESIQLNENAKSDPKNDLEQCSQSVSNRNTPLIKDKSIYASEMLALKSIAHDYDYREFVMHPVLSSFVFLKWKKIRFSLHINLIITLFFIFSFIPFIMISRTTQDGLAYKIFFGLSFTSLFILTFREILQFSLSKRRYFKSYSNLVDFAIIMCTIIVLFRQAFAAHHFRMLHTTIILLLTWEYFNLLGYLPLLSVSLHTKMFRKVFTTFLKSLAFYSVMVIGFALAFHTLQGDKAITLMKSSSNQTETKNVPEGLSSFASLRGSIVKSFVMMTGELDASNIYLEGYTYIGLFVLFLFIVTIVLYNLLNALAVSDTQEIRSDAKLIDLRQRILVMYRHEKNVFRVTSRMSTFLQKVISLFPDTLVNGQIILKPNVNRNTYIEDECSEPIKNDWLPNILCYFGKNMTMDEEIIQDMRTMLVKKREEHSKNIVRNFKERRSDKMANDILKLNEQIDKLSKALIHVKKIAKD